MVPFSIFQYLQQRVTMLLGSFLHYNVNVFKGTEKPGTYKNWWEYIPGGEKLKEYCDVTTLHGFKYLGEPGRSLSERIFWIFSLLFVNIILFIAIYDQIFIYLRFPVLMSLESSSTPTWEIPFPALTFCSENQIKPSVFNYKELFNKSTLSEKENHLLQFASLICALDLQENKTDYIKEDYVNYILNEGFSSCSTTFFAIKWLDKLLENPCQYMQPMVILHHGACHTFNLLPPEHLFKPTSYYRSQFHNQTIQSPSKEEGNVWTPDTGFKGPGLFNNMPWRTSKSGLSHDVTLFLNLSSNDFDDTCFFGGRGFMVYIHSPAELPSSSDPSVYLKVDEFTSIKVTPQLKKTQKDLRNWKPEDRGCFFEQERPLQFFQFYTEKNCDTECETNLSISLCGCATYNQPRLSTTPICGPKKERCIEDSFVAFNENHQDMYSACNCLPSCTEISYQVAVTSVNRNFSYLSIRNIYSYLIKEKIMKHNFALVGFSFQARKIIAMKRVATFGLSDFIANIGGLLGLFLGFSFLSFLEVIYFITLRFRKRQTNKIKPSINF